MAIAINSNFERDQYVAAAGQTQFNFSFPIFSQTYIKVYKRLGAATPNDFVDILTLGVDYSVSGVGAEAGGFITLVVPAALGDIVTLVGEEPIERESVFDDLNPFTAALNQQLNESTVMAQQTYTYLNHVTPRYYFSTLVSNEVRPKKRFLPMLPDGYVWVGRGELGDDPDDIVTAPYGDGSGNVISTGTPMRRSIANWTGVATVITDSDLWVNGYFIDRTDGSLGDRTGWADTWGAMHWPAHITGGRPAAPQDGDTYYDSTLLGYYGYENGAWVRFSTGSDSSLIKRIVNQVGHGLVKGNWVRVNNAGLYVKSYNSDAINAEVYGLVVLKIDDDNFVLQTDGYVSTADAVFAGMTPGEGYFLDSAAGGQISAPPVTPGFVRKPVFLAESATSGYVKIMLGTIVAGQPQLIVDGPNIHTVPAPGHTFDIGEWLRIDGETSYTQAQGDSLANAQAIGVVIAITADTFTIQQSGYNVGAVFEDENNAALVAGIPYYISSTTPGQLTSVIPNLPGEASRPCYIPETIASNAGWIFPQRPLTVTSGGGGDIEGFDFINCTDAETVTLNPAVWTALPCLTVTLSPQNIASKFIIKAMINGAQLLNSVAPMCWRLTRNGVAIGTGASAGVQCYGRVLTLTFIAPFLYVDEPTTLLPVTYAFEAFCATGNVIYINTDNTTAFAGVSSMTVDEFM